MTPLFFIHAIIKIDKLMYDFSAALIQNKENIRLYHKVLNSIYSLLINFT